MKTNLTLICLFPKYSKKVAQLLAERLDMFYGDVDEMIDFELGDVNHILSALGSKDGKKYLKDTETKVIKNVASFENTVVSINPTTLMSSRNLDKFKKTSYMIYLQISPKYFNVRAEEAGDEVDEKLLNVAFSERDKIYVSNSDIVVNCSTFKVKKTTKKVLSAINAFFKKVKKHKKD